MGGEERMRRSRDEIVAFGLAAKEVSETSRRQKGPWIYKAKCKSGNRSTKNVEETYCNIPHLNGDLVAKHAREGEVFNIYAVTRIMKAHLRSGVEDV